MQLSAPIYRLKRKARVLSRELGIPLNQALDRVAADEGFPCWSLLAAKATKRTPCERLFSRLAPGDLVLLGARPGQGKTMLGIELLTQAIKAGNRGVFLTLEYTEKEVLDRYDRLVDERLASSGLLEIDASNDICADYIVRRLHSAERCTMAVIDYLQLLDQKRDKPNLMDQIRTLRSFASERGLILVFISQIDRSYDPAMKRCPDIYDVRLPNPLDLGLFTRTCFLNGSEICMH